MFYDKDHWLVDDPLDVVNVEPDFRDIGMPPQKPESYREHKRKEIEYLKTHREDLTAPKNIIDLDKLQRQMADLLAKKYETDPCFANIKDEIKNTWNSTTATPNLI